LPGNSSVRSPAVDSQDRLISISNSQIAIQQGQAASMSLLLAYLKQSYPGEVLDVKLRDTSGGLVYEVRYLSNVIFLLPST